jgi:raffinose/stachyose/melibiose transport system permease protein
VSRPDPEFISTGLQLFQRRYSRDWGLTSAASVIMIVPIVLLFLFMQRRFIEGLSRSRLKG